MPTDEAEYLILLLTSQRSILIYTYLVALEKAEEVAGDCQTIIGCDVAGNYDADR